MRTSRPVRAAARWLATAVCALVAVVSASVPVRLALTPPAGARPDAVLDARTLAHLRHLTAALDGGAAERMQGLFPEGFVFTNALVGLSWARVAAMDVPDAVQAEALDGARRASAALESAAGRAPFPAVQSPRYGAFHAGWSAYLLGQTLAATPPEQRAPADVRRFRAMCRHLDAAFDASPFPPSYPGAAWPADAAVGVAALRLHDRLFPPRYGPTVARWVRGARARLDPATGLVPHAADAATGAPQGGARGESQALVLRFLPEIDAAFAREQYRRYRPRFVTTRLGLPVVLGVPAGFRGTPDIDSGPLPLGVGLPATVVGLGAARANGDAVLAEPLDRELEALGLPVSWGARRAYGFGAVPIGEAFLVWARLTPAAAADAALAPVTGRAWAFGTSATCTLVAALALILAYRLLHRS